MRRASAPRRGSASRQCWTPIADYLPPPKGGETDPLKALIFDSYYDNYKGAISFVRIKEGSVRPGSTIRFMAGGKEYLVTETGIFTPRFQPVGELCAGDVGYIAASIKTVADTRVGDTITDAANPAAEALPGYKKALPVVFCGIYPADGGAL